MYILRCITLKHVEEEWKKINIKPEVNKAATQTDTKTIDTLNMLNELNWIFFVLDALDNCGQVTNEIKHTSLI